MAQNIRPQLSYGFTNPLNQDAQKPMIVPRDPLPTDQAFLGTIWVNPVNGACFILDSVVANIAKWSVINPKVAFRSALLAIAHNVTGDGTAYFPQFVTTAPGVGCYDLSGNFDNVNYRFIPPIAGIYHFDVIINLQFCAAGNNTAALGVGVYGNQSSNPFAVLDGAGISTVTYSGDLPCGAGPANAITVSIAVGGLGLTIDVIQLETVFSGHLVTNI